MSSRATAARVRAVAVVFLLTIFALVAPMLVLCEDGDRHAAVESALTHCCPQKAAAPGEASGATEVQGAAGSGCAGSCTDTPLLADFALTSPRHAALGSEGPAVVSIIVPAPSPAPSFARTEVGCWPALSPAAFGRSTVLLI